MTITMRRLEQPGPAAAERIDSFEGTGVVCTFTLQRGLTLREAIATPLQAAGIQSAAVVLGNVEFEPFQYVMPAFSNSPEHVAYYSDTFKPSGPMAIQMANATYGRRDGAPFLHCHALWLDAEGQQRGGHLVPTETVIAAPSMAQAWGLANVAMQAEPDPETNFTLFHPIAVEPAAALRPDGGPRIVVARIRPNEDLVESIEAVAKRHGMRNAIVRGSLGSIVGAEFENGDRVDDIATEILVLDGRVSTDASGDASTRLDIALIDPHGDIHKGRLVRGRNAVLICFELVLEEIA